jgi:DNA polymerase-3 subunit epsilon
MSLDFAVVDVETANEKFESICSIGVAKFRSGQLEQEFYTLVNPETYFSNTYIHGIKESDVAKAPKLREGLDLMDKWLSEDHKRVVCHMPFDRTATTRAAMIAGISLDHFEWHDSARAVRLGWQEYSKSGYGLKKISDKLGINFEHHNALADAKAAGLVLIEAAKRIDQNIASLWDQISLDAARRVRIKFQQSASLKLEANPDGEFFGQGICFTGTLPNMTRNEAKSFAAALGFTTLDSVNSDCNILVVAEIDNSRLALGATKTGKWLKAEKMISEGKELRIISPTDFVAMLG